MSPAEIAILVLLVGLGILGLLILRKAGAGTVADPAAAERLIRIEAGTDRTGQSLREELALVRQEQGNAARSLREEVLGASREFGATLQRQVEELARQAEARGTAQAEQQLRTATEQRGELNNLGEALTGRLKERLDAMAAQLTQLAEKSGRSSEELRLSVEQRLEKLNEANAAKLEEMRATVDEKLHATLEDRLTKSFGLVSDRLEKVQAGLGEMRDLATGVGDLKRVLTNVKNRGGWAEIQLGALLEQMLTQDQYAQNVKVRPDTKELVEFAIKLPGDDQHVWLPIDAKFPKEDYERLVDAYERADVEAIEASGAALQRAVLGEAKKICDKYIAPPHTTNFAIMYLPSEGLFAEVIRRPGLVDEIQSKCRVTIAGPTTFSALLNSLQMGFRTLSIQQRSGEVWKILEGTKSEFGKMAGLWEKMDKQLSTVQNTVRDVGVKTRKIHKQLGRIDTVEIVAPSAQALLGIELDDTDSDDEESAAAE